MSLELSKLDASVDKISADICRTSHGPSVIAELLV